MKIICHYCANCTIRYAAHFGLTDRGRIATGLRADLLLVRGQFAFQIDDVRFLG